MPQSFAQLIRTMTEQEAIDYLLDSLRSFGYNTSGWQSGRVQRQLIQGAGKALAGVSSVLPSMARGVILGLSEGAHTGWLSLIGPARYGITADPGRRAVHRFRYTLAASASPVSITYGSRVSDGTYSYRVSASLEFGGLPLALAAGASVDVELTADTVGAAQNRGLGTISQLTTAYPGATGANVDNGDGTSIRTAGLDPETDPNYTERCQLQREALRISAGVGYYESLARTTEPAITRTFADESGYPTIAVYCATASGTATAPQLAAAQVAFDDPALKGINDLPVATAAPGAPIAFVLNPVVSVGGVTAAEIEAAITAYCGALPLGGTRVEPTPTVGRLVRDRVIAMLMALRGMQAVNMTAPAADEVLGAGEAIAPTYTTTVTYA